MEIGKVIVITLNFTNITFGEHWPSPINNVTYNATRNNEGGYGVRVEPESNDVDWIWIKGTNMTLIGGHNNDDEIIGVSNITWNKDVNDKDQASPLNYSYQLVASNVQSNTSFPLFFWLWIPPVQAGNYNGTIYLYANSTW